MDEIQAVSGLYVPYCIEKDGPSQPISTAVPLDAGKNLCLNHFLQRCRTLMHRLPPGQGMEVPAALPDRTICTWVQSPSGVYEGRPEEHLQTSIISTVGTTYQLRPVG